MLIDCINKAKNIEEVVIFYFETNHGQSEGDSIHSVVERALKRVKEIVTPSQLSGVIRLASKKPYHVVDVDTNSIQDFKELSQTLAILRVRLTDAGAEIRWPDFKQMKITKQNTKVIYFKYSHTEEDFHVISLPSRRNLSLSVHQAYANPPSIAETKYTDLMLRDVSGNQVSSGC
ncbi:hypothetical protein SNE40_020438 [Patella caerulea]|uniref:Uncharacterized protein n=1 Tax=Patella caerulea TaxID=87958 RepID=A0AAN8J4N1_PATCE